MTAGCELGEHRKDPAPSDQLDKSVRSIAPVSHVRRAVVTCYEMDRRIHQRQKPPRMTASPRKIASSYH